MTTEWMRARLAEGGGVVRGHGSAELAALSRASRRGALTRLLPGVYGEPDCADHLTQRARALLLTDPDAILCGRAAAAVTWWPGLAVPTLDAARRFRCAAAPGYRWSQRALPLDRVIELPGGLRATDPALTVLDLVKDLGGTVIDEALRRGAVSLADLHAALADAPGRRGNHLRRALLRDSRDEPWSEAERLFHRILRAARLPWPYRTNLRIELPGAVRYLDAALPELRLGFEIDGYAHHGDPVAFARDRRGDVALALAGWRIHRFAAVTIADDPAWVSSAVIDLATARALEIDGGRAPRAA